MKFKNQFTTDFFNATILIGDDMNYNQEYINQFGEKFLLEYLKSKNLYKLNEIYESYLNQFSSNKISDPFLLLIKSS